MKMNSKINSTMIVDIITIVVFAIVGIGGYYTLKAQVADTAKVAREIKHDTAKNVEGTLKSDVEQNKGDISDCIKNIEVLRANLENIEKAQSELKVEVKESNKEMKAMMRLILQKLD